jgi:hypothetical protein
MMRILGVTGTACRQDRLAVFRIDFSRLFCPLRAGYHGPVCFQLQFMLSREVVSYAPAM